MKEYKFNINVRKFNEVSKKYDHLTSMLYLDNQRISINSNLLKYTPVSSVSHIHGYGTITIDLHYVGKNNHYGNEYYYTVVVSAIYKHEKSLSYEEETLLVCDTSIQHKGGTYDLPNDAVSAVSRLIL